MRIALILFAACGARASAPIVDNHGGGAAAGLELTVSAGGGGHAAIVHNAGAEAVWLRRDLTVNRVGDATPLETVDLYLRDDCRSEPPVCVELASGATLRAVPWDDEIGDAQCGCDKGAAAPAGEYTFTVARCDGGAPVTSAPFEVSAGAR